MKALKTWHIRSMRLLIIFSHVFGIGRRICAFHKDENGIIKDKYCYRIGWLLIMTDFE